MPRTQIEAPSGKAIIIGKNAKRMSKINQTNQMTMTPKTTLKTEKTLGWVPEITLEEMIAAMMPSDLQAAKRQVRLNSRGHAVAVSAEKFS
jgi:GDP-D-mannose dehydratase